MRRSDVRGWTSRRPITPPTRTPPKSAPLWHFLLIATIVVVAVGSLVFARRQAPPDLRITGNVTGTPTPTAERPDAAASGGEDAAFAGQGAWAMSSLPTCFAERTRIRGSVAQLRSKLPPDSERLPPATVVRRGDCTLTVGAHDIRIDRGGDRLRVPPESALYAHGDRLTLVHAERGREEIRVY